MAVGARTNGRPSGRFQRGFYRHRQRRRWTYHRDRAGQSHEISWPAIDRYIICAISHVFLVMTDISAVATHISYRL